MFFSLSTLNSCFLVISKMFAVSKNPSRIGIGQLPLQLQKNPATKIIFKFLLINWQWRIVSTSLCTYFLTFINLASVLAALMKLLLLLKFYCFSWGSIHGSFFILPFCCYLILFSDFEHHRYTDSQICIDEIRLLFSSKLKLSIIFGINYISDLTCW